MSERHSSIATVEVVVAVVHRDGKILICQRFDDAEHLPGYWEFPGGKREADETIEACLHRELREELDLAVTVVRELAVIEHDYPVRRVRLVPILCNFTGAEPKAIGCQQFAWITPDQLAQYHFPPANDALLDEIRNYFRSSSASGEPLI